MSRSTNPYAPPKRTAQEAAAHVTAEIARLLEQGVMPWRAPWDPKRAAAATPGLPLRATGEPYRGANVVLLWASQITRGYSKRTWLSFRQAEALGAHVRRGEKATPVVYYGQVKSREKINSPTDDSAAKTFRFLKLFHVFNAEQLENVPNGFAIETTTAPPPPSAIDAWAGRADARVRVGGASAYYSPTTDTIHMPPHAAFVSEEHRVSTLCHELAHYAAIRIMPRQRRRRPVRLAPPSLRFGIIRALLGRPRVRLAVDIDRARCE